MIKLRHKVTMSPEEWTPEDDANMRELVAYPLFQSAKKLLRIRMNTRVDELITGKETRPQIQEVADILLQLDHYADPRELE